MHILYLAGYEPDKKLPIKKEYKYREIVQYSRFISPPHGVICPHFKVLHETREIAYKVQIIYKYIYEIQGSHDAQRTS